MRLKVFRAASVAEAMAQIRGELGADALILATRRAGEGVEITAALEPADEPAACPPPLPAPPVSQLADFAFHGVPPAMADRFQGADLPQALRAVLRFGPLPLGPDGDGASSRPLFLAGLPGAGKTLSVARLATRLVLAGMSPLVITADGRRAGAPEELAAYTRLLGIGRLVAATPAALRRALNQRGPHAAVLVDSAGIDPFAPTELALAAELAQACDARPVLVMPAGLQAEEAAEQVSAFEPLGIRHLLATRLDLSRRLGSVIAAAISGNLILTEAGIGASATEGLVPLTPAFLAERLRMKRPAAAQAPPHAPPARRPPPAQPAYPANPPHSGRVMEERTPWA
jgi:flagellar biosynthesis protein FlhF